MNVPTPHFLLFSEARTQRGDEPADSHTTTGQWRFVLESLDGREKLEAADEESRMHGDRLELLAVVRGLEALDQPSRVTLITQSRYVARGIRSGLDEWRASDWQWERFGERTPVKNDDLWRRVDRALKFHQVECRAWKFESVESANDQQEYSESPRPQPSVSAPSVSFGDSSAGRHYRVDAAHTPFASESAGEYPTNSVPAPSRRRHLSRIIP